jgi:succinate dehydrogenase / fumarate reductase cytochrome b subunit
VLGVAASVFHFTNGLWGFCFSWGVTVSRRAQRTSATVFGLLGVVLFLIGANTAIYFATGSRIAFSGHLFGSVSAQAVRTCAEIQTTPAAR